MDETKYEFQIEKIYLEIARSIINWPLKELIALQNDGKIDRNKAVNISFGIVSISCIYSYASIEAFCNRHLWGTQTRIIDVENSKIGKSGWRYLGHSRKSLMENKLVFNVKEELKEKFKKLCKLYKIKSIEDKNPKLWNRFNQLMKDARNFIIHPKPNPEEFQERMTKILSNHNTGEYVTIASAIIKYFYGETKRPLPKWLHKNNLFEFSGIKIPAFRGTQSLSKNSAL